MGPLVETWQPPTGETPAEGSAPPAQRPLPMRTDRVGTEITRIYEVTSILELVGSALDGVSGDEDSVDIAMNLSVPAGAVRSARTLLLEIAEHLQAVQPPGGGHVCGCGHAALGAGLSPGCATRAVQRRRETRRLTALAKVRMEVPGAEQPVLARMRVPDGWTRRQPRECPDSDANVRYVTFSA